MDRARTTTFNDLKHPECMRDAVRSPLVLRKAGPFFSLVQEPFGRNIDTHPRRGEEKDRHFVSDD